MRTVLALLGEVEQARRTGILAVLVVVAALLALVVWQQLGPSAPQGGIVPVAPAASPLASSAYPSPPATSPSPRPTRTASPSAPPPTSRPSPLASARLAALRAVPVASLSLGMDCAGQPVAVDATAYGTFWAGRASVAVSAHCDAGAGSPPSVLTVLVDSAAQGPARPVTTQVLVSEREDLLIDRLSATARGLTATGLGFSGSDIPRCCPDTDVRRTWRWDGARLA